MFTVRGMYGDFFAFQFIPFASMTLKNTKETMEVVLFVQVFGDFMRILDQFLFRASEMNESREALFVSRCTYGMSLTRSLMVCSERTVVYE